MRLKKRQGDKFVLMLGAGASMSSGVKSTPRLMEELLAQYGADLNGSDRLEDRFDKLWQRTSDRDRRALLQPYLEHEPSVGYAKLAALIEAGYFDLALTFNFDDLVEKALNGIGFSDYKRVIRGETRRSGASPIRMRSRRLRRFSPRQTRATSPARRFTSTAAGWC